MTSDGIYTRTSIGRVLDPDYPTNMAVLILVPAAAILAGFVALWEAPAWGQAVATGVRGGIAAFVGWALGRELAPDDNAAAFVSLGFTFLISIMFPQSSVLLAFITLMLVRIVNRSTGLPARLTDSIFVTALAGWAVYSTRTVGPGVVAALAFALDAILPGGLRRQWVFAAVCLMTAPLLLNLRTIATVETGLVSLTRVSLLALIALASATVILTTRHVEFRADATGEPLILSRVRMGMLVALLVAIQGFFPDSWRIEQTFLVWAALAGVALTILLDLTLQQLAPRKQRT
jgi:hypothetical protein